MLQQEPLHILHTQYISFLTIKNYNKILSNQDQDKWHISASTDFAVIYKSSGHDTHYCNRVAPNDPKGRICSKVGPHKKENSDEYRSPIKKEYDRTYDRLSKRKSSGLDYAKWLEQSTLAMDIKDRGESGEISLDEAIRILKEI